MGWGGGGGGGGAGGVRSEEGGWGREVFLTGTACRVT